MMIPFDFTVDILTLRLMDVPLTRLDGDSAGPAFEELLTRIADADDRQRTQIFRSLGASELRAALPHTSRRLLARLYATGGAAVRSELEDDCCAIMLMSDDQLGSHGLALLDQQVRLAEDRTRALQSEALSAINELVKKVIEPSTEA